MKPVLEIVAVPVFRYFKTDYLTGEHFYAPFISLGYRVNFERPRPKLKEVSNG